MAALFANDFNLVQSLSNHFFGFFLSLFEIFLASFFICDKSAASCKFFCFNSLLFFLWIFFSGKQQVPWLGREIS